MAILKSPRQNMANKIFQFAANIPEFDLIDIVNEEAKSNNIKPRNFFIDEGYYVYRSMLIVNDRQAEELGLEGLRFEDRVQVRGRIQLNLRIAQSVPQRSGTDTYLSLRILC